MGKRIHELAKEWGIAPKDLIAKLDELGITGRRSQSSLTDHEVERLAAALGRVPQPAVTVGSERVVGGGEFPNTPGREPRRDRAG